MSMVWTRLGETAGDHDPGCWRSLCLARRESRSEFAKRVSDAFGRQPVCVGCHSCGGKTTLNQDLDAVSW